MCLSYTNIIKEGNSLLSMMCRVLWELKSFKACYVSHCSRRLPVVLCVIKCLWVKMYPTPFIQLTIFIFSMSVDIYDIFLLPWTSFLRSSQGCSFFMSCLNSTSFTSFLLFLVNGPMLCILCHQWQVDSITEKHRSNMSK